MNCFPLASSSSELFSPESWRDPSVPDLTGCSCSRLGLLSEQTHRSSHSAPEFGAFIPHIAFKNCSPPKEDSTEAASRVRAAAETNTLKDIMMDLGLDSSWSLLRMMPGWGFIVLRLLPRCSVPTSVFNSWDFHTAEKNRFHHISRLESEQQHDLNRVRRHLWTECSSLTCPAYLF